ncbi:MAG: FlgD immunoglobulin-like domain containing protein, partial [Bacteroidota bacterium]
AVSSTGAVIKLADPVSGVSDSLYVSFGQGASPLASVNGVLFADQCDSVRILNLIFTWGAAFPPYQVPNLNWKAGRNQNVEQNFPLPPTAPGFPKDAHVIYVIFPDGRQQSLDIDTLVAGKRYVLGPPCPTTGVGDESSLPQKVQLSQNFPNPFNPNTVITYALPSETYVSLVIYDMLGREVVRLVDNTRQRAGYYEMQWNGRDTRGVQMPSGTYFIRLEAQRYTETRKLLLLK